MTPLAFCVAMGFLLGCNGPSDPPDARVDAEIQDAGGPTVDAGPPPCGTLGDTRVSTCGSCGMRSEECGADMLWQPTSMCLGELECAAGTSETEDLPLCGQRQRICLDGCMWGAWQEIASPGVCEPDQIQFLTAGCPAFEQRIETCTETCAWVETMGCHDPCGGTPRTSPDWKQEVCIPAGMFVRGSLDYADTQPVTEVFVSAFYIARNPVTNDHYRECFDAAVCPDFRFMSQGWLSFRTSGRGDYPVQSLDRATAEAFCAWDGGRRLPTEAEWEKAVRGPTPRTNAFPWDGATPSCAQFNSGDCGYRPSDFWTAPDPYDGLPVTRSYFGTFMQYGGIHEWVSDDYSAGYYADPGSRIDPTGPSTGEGLLRGIGRRRLSTFTLAFRLSWPSYDPTPSSGVRCARSAP